ncbi:hypothetical protein ASPWEDRAFT_37284 [Aspergillus wentii DTO 134E9]|uniref:Major facilitator superfamily (MFS) profile domain-containing protein n=1 Tax=Aspergillus wentii DTO 134E9 TaxID=1073089 RepID=A0A1L9RX51_ASPWE|nr:uncharacterized protein ASPWEDRAFT_37284 [Aspergillus wentii DTO 134E9]KAI9931822.1 hypothetical protein MW887_010406 [Aspergillus wentii]OJJ39495.1 hypothetical protein ASPWEDRAFT_37284 [Aspergillus wentii DTO 134E9]
MLEKPARLPVQQLVILSICRFAEPVVLTSILPYLPEMISYVGVQKDDIAKWVGITSAVTAAAQAAMAVPWGTASDYMGRKPIILLGLTCTMVFSVLFGFSQNLPWLIVSRGLLGFMNGNVGIIRTMVAEMVPHKELQPRAFSIMPLVWTLGGIFGPAFGGALARPAEKHPELFGDSEFLKKFPFVLPNLASACIFIVGIATGFLFLKETLKSKKDRPDYGLALGQLLISPCTGQRRENNPRVEDDERRALLGDGNGLAAQNGHKKQAKRPVWRQIFTPQSNLVLLAYALLAMHTFAYDSLLPVFLYYPVQEIDGNPDVHLPFKFVGGFGVDSQTIGIFYAIIGIIGMVTQFLVFPAVAKRYGALKCSKAISLIYPVLYLVTPFTALVPASLRKFSVFLVMLTKLAASIFAFPCITILLTNSASSLSVLGTLNGVGTSVSALGRAAGPAIVGWAFSFGVKRGYVIIPWWTLCLIGAISAIPVFSIKETDGFEDKDDESEEDQPQESENGSNGGTYGAVSNGRS